MATDSLLISNIDHILLHEQTILSRLDQMAADIVQKYRGLDLTVLAVLNGSLIFAADLLRRIPLPLKLECLSVSSYHGGTSSTGVVTFDQLSFPEIAGRHVLIVDDILDTGRTLSAIRSRLVQESSPLSVSICVLLRKQKTRDCEVEADFAGFEIGDEFVVGYGLDFAEEYRNLPFVGVLKPEIFAAAAQTGV